MEGVTGAAWVGMQSLEHAFENNQRLEIKSRQRSTAQPISSSIHGPAAARGKTTLPTSTTQQVTGLLPTAKKQPNGPPQPPQRRVGPKNWSISALPAQQGQNKTVYRSPSNCTGTTENRLHLKSHGASNLESSWPSGQHFSKLTFR